MAKLVVMMLFMIALALSLALYQGGTALQSNALYQFVTNSNEWTTSNLFGSIVTIALSLAAAGAVAGVTLGFVTDFMLFGAAVFGLLTMGFIYIQFQQLFHSELYAFLGCAAASDCLPADWITWVVVAPIAFLYVWTVVSWWRGQDN